MPPIYHFTDLANLEAIFDDGALRCHRDAVPAVNVGNESIKGNRQWIGVRCGAGGMVCDYVPFYFAPRSPMLFSIKCGNVDGVDPDQRRLAYLVSSTEAAYAAGLDCVFSDGNAAKSMTVFDDDAANFGMVDWDIMEERYWSNTPEDPDRVRRRMAEFLIHEAAPLDLFDEIAVRTPAARDEVVALVAEAGLELPVKRRPAWYF